MIKRILDIFFSLIGFPVFLLVYIVIAPIIKFTDNGPVFFVAMRIGKDGNFFKMYKFRTMMVDAPDIRLEDGSTFNGSDDPRVTRIGRLLRKLSIDEIPQVINILKGDMSLIGPRPDPPDWLSRYNDEYKIILTVKPGLTGYNQAYYRNSADGIQKMKNDAFYAENICFLMDFKIFLKSISCVVKMENTYKPENGDRKGYLTQDQSAAGEKIGS